MKTKLFTLLFFLLIVSGFIYFNTEGTEKTDLLWPGPNPDKFIYGAIQSIWSYPNYDSLGLNTTHCYISTKMSHELGRHVPMGWANNDRDSLTADISVYADDLRTAKNQMYSHNQSRFFYQRPKIEWLAFGQSSIYECEDDADVNSDLWFYAFNVSTVIQNRIINGMKVSMYYIAERLLTVPMQA